MNIIKLLLFIGLLPCLASGSAQQRRIQRAFFKAVESHRFDEADQLLAQGADINGEEDYMVGEYAKFEEDGYSSSPYKASWAMVAKYSSKIVNNENNDLRLVVIAYLLSRGADLKDYSKIYDKYGEYTGFSHRTPLYKAVSYGHYAMVKLLLEYGAFVNVRDCEGNTPLHQAVQLNKIALVALLLNPPPRKEVVRVGQMDPHTSLRMTAIARQVALLEGDSTPEREKCISCSLL